MEKVLQELKVAKRKQEFLKEFLVFALQEQNKYIAINHKEEIENYNKIIFKTLNDIDTLTLTIHELKRDARLVR
jgi:hypothetical protein